jgi:hypothetical protein
VLGTGLGSVEHAHRLRQWSDHVILFAHTAAISDGERATLQARGVATVDGTVERARRRRRPPAGHPARRRPHRRPRGAVHSPALRAQEITAAGEGSALAIAINAQLVQAHVAGAGEPLAAVHAS